MKPKIVVSHEFNYISDEDAKDFIRKADAILRDFPEIDGSEAESSSKK